MKISQAILPIAGLGTRFLPWTKVVPKELLPIGSQPIIAHLVNECLDAGITDICFVISKGKEGIPQYFAPHPLLEEELKRRGKETALDELKRYDNMRLHVVYQDEQRGDGHAILQAADWLQSPVVAVLFGDDLIVGRESALEQMLRVYKDLPDASDPAALLCLENIERELVSKYGIVALHPESGEGRLKRIHGLVEKPAPATAPSTLGIVGKYLIPRSIIDVLPSVQSGHDGEIRLIDALTSNLPVLRLYGYEFEGTRFDTGTPEGYRRAVQALG